MDSGSVFLTGPSTSVAIDIPDASTYPLDLATVAEACEPTEFKANTAQSHAQGDDMQLTNSASTPSAVHDLESNSPHQSPSSTPDDVSASSAAAAPLVHHVASPTIASVAVAAGGTRGWFTRALEYLFEGRMKQADKIEVIYCTRSGCEKLFTKYFAAVLLVVITVLTPILLLSHAFSITETPLNNDRSVNQTSAYAEGFCANGQNTVLVNGNIADCFTSAAVNYPMMILFLLYSFIHVHREKPFIGWRASLLPKLVWNAASCLFLAKALVVILEIFIIRRISSAYPVHRVTDLISRTLSHSSYLLVITCDFIKGRKHRSFIRVFAVVYLYTRVQRVLYGINTNTLDGVLIAQLILNIIQALLVTPVTFLTDLELQAPSARATPNSLVVRSIRNAGVWGVGGVACRIALSIGEGALTVIGVNLLSRFIANGQSRTSATAVVDAIVPISLVWLGALICRCLGGVLGSFVTLTVGNHFKTALFDSFKEHVQHDSNWLKTDPNDADDLQTAPVNASAAGVPSAMQPPAKPSITSNYMFQRMWMINSTFKHAAVYVDYLVNQVCTVCAPCTQAIAATVYLVQISRGFSTMIVGSLILFASFTKFRVRSCREHCQKVVMMNDIEPYGVGTDLYPAAFDKLAPANCNDYRKYLYYVQKQTIALSFRVALFDLLEYSYLLLALSTWIIFGNVFMIEGGFAKADFTSYVLLSKQLHDAFCAIIVIVLKWAMVNPSYENMSMGLMHGWFRYPIPYKRRRADTMPLDDHQGMAEKYRSSTTS